jgi:hypothetical protein
MAFKLTQSPTYKTPIIVELPNDKGTFDKSDFIAIFKRTGVKEIEEMQKMSQREVLERVLLGWEKLIDEDGNDVSFNEATRAALFDIAQAQIALVAGFWGSIYKVKEKN